MPRLPSVEILHQELEQLFIEWSLWDKIRDRRLSTEPISASEVASWNYPGGTSQIVKHRNALGLHVATTHRVVMPGGAVPHWDAKDVRVGDVVVVSLKEASS
jgi:hypothetical protein